jgi:hypothetical protein
VVGALLTESHRALLARSAEWGTARPATASDAWSRARSDDLDMDPDTDHAAGRDAATVSALIYLCVKVVWIVLSANGTETPAGWSVTGWVALNAVTLVVPPAGGLFGLAIAHGWHRALPTPVLVTVLWLVSGFLISLLPYMASSALLGSLGVLGSDASSGSDRPGDPGSRPLHCSWAPDRCSPGAWRLAVSVWNPPEYDAAASMPVPALQYSLAIGAGGVALHAVLERCRLRDLGRTAPPGQDSVTAETVAGS